MSVKIQLNNLNYRYEVYQIVNLFYNLEEIEFVEAEADYFISINENFMNIGDEDTCHKYEFTEDLSLKDQIKKYVYMYFSEKNYIDLPWGTLIGIRPSKIALSLINAGMKDEDIVKYFYHRYMTQEEKVKLCIDIAKYENSFVNSDAKSISVYIGMPFCPTRCLYCSFTSNPIGGNQKLVEPYLACLIKEIKAISEYIKEKDLQIQCVYFGGGTPTAVKDEEFEELMSFIYKNLIEEFKVEEFTVECGRPDSISFKKLSTMKKYAVDRISINPQTMNDCTLKAIGRNHSTRDVVEKFNMARELGFQNINMDMIIGLPGEGIEELENTCRAIKKLNPESLTIHGMSIKRASRLYEDLCLNKKYALASQKDIIEMHDKSKSLAQELNMYPYYMYRQKNMVGNMENVGYSLKGKECIYNIQMIEEKQTIIALGADAVSKVVFLEENRIERFPNVKDVREYISRIDEMIEKKKELLDSLYN